MLITPDVGRAHVVLGRPLRDRAVDGLSLLQGRPAGTEPGIHQSGPGRLFDEKAMHGKPLSGIAPRQLAQMEANDRIRA